MRSLILQRLVCTLLLAGVAATWLPFGYDVQQRAQWIDRFLRLSDDAPQADVRTAYLHALAHVPPDSRAYVEAVAGLDVTDPAWFGAEAFTPDVLDRIAQEMGTVPPVRAGDAAFAPAPASPPPARSGLALDLMALADPHDVTPQGTALLELAAAQAAPYATLLGTALSPRAP